MKPLRRVATHADATQRRISFLVAPALFLRAMAKMALGVVLPSQPLLYDGASEVIDAAMHFALVAAGRHSRRADAARYPLGRGPVVDLAAFLLGISLLAVGLRSIGSATSALMHTLALPETVRGLLEYLLPAAHETSSAHPVIAGVALLASGVISRALAAREARLARGAVPPLRELVAEATDLRAASILEMGLGLGLLAQAVLGIAEGATRSPAVVLAHALAPSLVLGILGIEIVWYGVREVREYGNNLLNPALEPHSYQRLDASLRAELPGGCDIVALTAYRRAEDVFATGYVAVPRALMASGHEIREHLERHASSFLEPFADAVHVMFAVSSPAEELDPEAEQMRLLGEVWGVAPDAPVAAVHRLHCHGQSIDAAAALASVELRTPPERLLAAWLRADLALEVRGPLSAEAVAANKEAAIAVAAASPDDASAVFLASWRLIRATQARIAPEALDELRSWLEEARARGTLPGVARAEAAHALGFSWERAGAYDLAKARDQYQDAERLLRASGYAYQAVRLLTTWGHHLTLVYELVPGILKLEEARSLRRRLGDEVGLAFVQGCLADAYGRCGQFDRADECYAEDLRLSHLTGTDRFVVGVLCKQGEMRIRRGAADGDERWIRRGIALCEQAEAAMVTTGGGNPFFVRKGQAKGRLALAALLRGTPEATRAVDYARAALAGAPAGSPYEEAFTARLSGRIAAIDGDVATSLQRFHESADLFAGMTRRGATGDEGSLQSVVSRLESALVAYTASNDAWAELRAALRSLDDFVEPLGGLLGGARTRIEDLQPPDAAHPPRSAGNRDAVLRSLRRLIAFLEG